MITSLWNKTRLLNQEVHFELQFRTDAAKNLGKCKREILSLYKETHQIAPLFLHVICSDGLRDLQELVSRDVPKEQAETYMAQLQRFRFTGWREFIGR